MEITGVIGYRCDQCKDRVVEARKWIWVKLPLVMGGGMGHFCDIDCKVRYFGGGVEKFLKGFKKTYGF